MAYGDSPYDEPLQTAWEAFCDRLKEAGKLVSKDSIPARPLDRAQGYRWLTQNLALAFELGLENRNTKYPYFSPLFSPTRKQGGDNATSVYLHAWIDGQETYKVSGNRGTCSMINITSHGAWRGPLPNPWGDVPEAAITGADLQTEWDGSFVLWVSQTPHEGNWLRTTPHTRKIYVRQFFRDPFEVPMSIRIERVGQEGAPPLPGPEELTDAMQWAGEMLYRGMEVWPDLSLARAGLFDRAQANRFSQSAGDQQSDDSRQDPLRGRVIMQCHWVLEPDEALIVEFERPRTGLFWGIDTENIWAQSLDIRWRSVTLNSFTAAVDPDDRIRIVVAGRDPGTANWLDTSGLVEGFLRYRNMYTREQPAFVCTRVAFADLEAALPPDTSRITPEGRRQQLERQADAVRRRYRI